MHNVILSMALCGCSGTTSEIHRVEILCYRHFVRCLCYMFFQTFCLHICCTMPTTTSIVLTSGINKTTPDDNNRSYMLSVFS